MFKVGDTVTGIDKESHGYTTSDAIMRVVEVNLNRFGHLWVEVLSHKNKDKQHCVGNKYYVSPGYFVLVKSQFKGNR